MNCPLFVYAKRFFQVLKLHILCLKAKQVDAGTNNNNNFFFERIAYLARMPVLHMVLRYKDIHACDNYIVLTMNIIYNMYRAGEVSIHRACCEQAIKPCSLGGEVRFIQAQDQQVLPYVVREW